MELALHPIDGRARLQKKKGRPCGLPLFLMRAARSTQFLEGKMPCKAMMKLTARDGCITETGELFPALVVLPVLTGSCVLALALGAYCALRWLDAAGIAPGPGSMSVPRLVVAGDERETVCVCAGKLVESNVTFSMPVTSPRLRYESPGP